MEKYFKYLSAIARRCHDRYGHDYYESLNVAECIIKVIGDVVVDSARVHAVLEGEY